MQLRKFRGAKIALESNIQYVESAMARYISTADDLDSENIEKKVVDNVTKADDVIHQAQDMLTAVKQRIDEIQHEQANAQGILKTSRLDNPEMQLRKFRGAKIALESNIQYVESAMARYISTADDLDSENIEKVVDNVTKADDVIHQAQDMLTAVKQRIDEIQHEQATQPAPNSANLQCRQLPAPPTSSSANPQLPQPPAPPTSSAANLQFRQPFQHQIEKKI
ncbi:hypothetical protein Q1695_010109 [Nippostrongylus brasiliensis]|nr:hypothetical protein Q1695_010109 [Nippostrongylus brasiliensis]